MKDKITTYINPHKLFIGAFTPNWLLKRPELSYGAKLCYARLCQYAGNKACCFPSQTTLSMELGTQERQIRRFLKELQNYKLIEIERVGLKCSNRYRFLNHDWIIENITSIPSTDNGIDIFREDKLSGQDVQVLSGQDVQVLSAPIERESLVKESKDLNTLRFKNSFEKFWKEYPKKRSKGHAEKVWLKIMSGERLVEERFILQAVQRAKTSADWQKDKGRYIPHPATWLNARGWEDEIQTGEEAQDARFNFLKGHQKAGSGVQGSALG